jgi:hypothetical protein
MFLKINKLQTSLLIVLSLILSFSFSVSFVTCVTRLKALSIVNLFVFIASIYILLNLVIGFVLFKWIIPNFINHSVKSRSLWIVCSVLAGIWFIFAIPLFSGFDSVQDGLIIICDVVALSFLIFSIGLGFFTRPIKYATQIKTPWWIWLLYATPFILNWILYLLAYWPGSLSYDSINQWEQMVNFKFSDWHPVFHTLTNWLITRFWHSPAAIAFAQIFAMSLVLGWGLFEQRRFGAPRWLPWLITLIIIAIPSNGFMVIALWKDIFYSISMLALTILVFNITLSHGEWIRKPNAWLYLSVSALFVALYRHNGAPVAFVTLLSFLVVYRKLWKPFLTVLILTLLIWMGIRGPGYDVLGVDRSSNQPGIGMALVHLIARYTNTDTPFLPQDRDLLQKIRPEENWPYECHLETNLFFTKLDWANLREYTTDLAILSVKLIHRAPSVFFDHVICTSSFLYQITQSPGSLYEPIETGVVLNDFGIKRESKFVWLKNILDNSPNQSNQLFNWIFWRVPFWGYLLLASLILYGARSKNWMVLLVFLPVLLNMLPFVFMAVLQSFRYVYSTLIVSALMSGFFLFTDPIQKK